MDNPLDEMNRIITETRLALIAIDRGVDRVYELMGDLAGVDDISDHVEACAEHLYRAAMALNEDLGQRMTKLCHAVINNNARINVETKAD